MSYLMDRTKPGVTKCQRGFFEYVVRPLVVAWSDVFPKSKTLLDQMQANLVRWREKEEAAAAAE